MGVLQPYLGMRTFLALWVGQAGSMIGSGITRFAFVFFTYRDTQSATAVTLVALCAFLPKMILSPVAGTLVDRLGDRFGLVVPDAMAAAGMAVALVLSTRDDLTVGPMLVITSFIGAAEAVQYPALSAATSQLVDAHQYARADGLVSAARSGSDVGGPVIAGILLALPAGLTFAVGADAVLSLVAVVIASVIRVPSREGAGETRQAFWRDTTVGLRWIGAHAGFRRLAALFFVVNLVGVLGQIIIQPLVLARSGGDAYQLSFVLGCVGVGGIVGGFVMVAWGGPAHKVRGLLIGIIAVSLIGQIGFAVTTNFILWCVTGFLNGAIVVTINACNQAVWQTNVPKALLGRVFGGFVFIAQLSVPIAIASAGPIADYVLEPWAHSGGVLATAWASVVGRGAGTGMAALLAGAGALGVLAALAGLASRRLLALNARTDGDAGSAADA